MIDTRQARFLARAAMSAAIALAGTLPASAQEIRNPATALAAVSPPGEERRPDVSGGSGGLATQPSKLGAGAGHWLIVVIQATLVEKGCAEAVSGEWDMSTRQAALQALGTATASDGDPVAAPSEALLTALRGLPGRACTPTKKLKDDAHAAIVRPDIEEDADGTGKVQGATPKAKPKARVERDAEPAKRPVARSQSQSASGSGSRPSSGSQSSGGRQATAPAVFVRPVGAGSF